MLRVATNRARSALHCRQCHLSQDLLTTFQVVTWPRSKRLLPSHLLRHLGPGCFKQCNAAKVSSRLSTRTEPTSSAIWNRGSPR